MDFEADGCWMDSRQRFSFACARAPQNVFKMVSKEGFWIGLRHLMDGYILLAPFLQWFNRFFILFCIILHFLFSRDIFSLFDSLFIAPVELQHLQKGSIRRADSLCHSCMKCMRLEKSGTKWFIIEPCSWKCMSAAWLYTDLDTATDTEAL